MKLSVVICTHNPRYEYLNRTLDSLKSQDLPLADWELCIVDNCSKDPVSDSIDISWHPKGRIVEEKKPGLTQARLRGIDETKSETIVFFDDDNLPVKSYLSHTLRLLEEHANLGVLGAGKLIPEYEEQPAKELLPYMRYLALREVESPVWKNQPSIPPQPWGAGLIIRREVATRYAEKVNSSELRKGLGRSGDNLLSGEDDEFTWVGHELGFGHGIFPELEITHLIPVSRIQPDYLEKLIEGNGYSCAVMDKIHSIERGNPFRTPRFEYATALLRKGKAIGALKELLELIGFHRKESYTKRMTRARENGWRKARVDLEI